MGDANNMGMYEIKAKFQMKLDDMIQEFEKQNPDLHISNIEIKVGEFHTPEYEFRTYSVVNVVVR